MSSSSSDLAPKPSAPQRPGSFSSDTSASSLLELIDKLIKDVGEVQGLLDGIIGCGDRDTESKKDGGDGDGDSDGDKGTPNKDSKSDGGKSGIVAKCSNICGKLMSTISSTTGGVRKSGGQKEDGEQSAKDANVDSSVGVGDRDTESKKDVGDSDGDKGTPDKDSKSDGEKSGIVVKSSNFCGKLMSTTSSTTGGVGKSGGQKEDGEQSAKDANVDGSVGGGGCGDKDTSQIVKMQNYLLQIKAAIEKLKNFEIDFRSKVEDHGQDIVQLRQSLKSLTDNGSASVKDDPEYRKNLRKDVNNKLKEINREMRKLKHRIPASSSSKLGPGAAAHPEESNKRSAATSSGSTSSATLTGGKMDELLSLKESNSFSISSIYEEIQEIHRGLKDNEQKCLMSFVVFTENEELKKRMLTYWWEGEQLLGDDDGKKTIEEVAGGILDGFVKKGLIEPVYKKRWPIVKAYRMQPVVRSAIIKLATVLYDKVSVVFIYGNLAARFKIGKMPPDQPIDVNQTPKKKDMKRTPSGGNTSEESSSREKWDPEKVETIFNVNEPFPDLKMKSLVPAKDKLSRLTTQEWLLKMKAIKVLYLGSWRASGHKHHIEVDSTDFLEGLRNMSSLRLLSLQGISGINELTSSIKGLKELRILDLKACHTLEELPKEISWLQKLTHLDVSDCYLMDHMPKGLSSLTSLQVLKGFVVGDYGNQTRKFCTLGDLTGMKKLRKLSIVTSKKEFPTNSELMALEKLQKLKKLTLLWGADSTQSKTSSTSNQPSEGTSAKNKKPDRTSTLRKKEADSPWKLEKLDLQCYPLPTAPKWLKPEKLDSLTKLYIRGGKLGDENLGLSSGVKWKSVQNLRLTYLAALKMGWEDLLSFFPELNYLEKVDCPLITMCPCDEDGVWVKHDMAQS